MKRIADLSDANLLALIVIACTVVICLPALITWVLDGSDSQEDL